MYSKKQIAALKRLEKYLSGASQKQLIEDREKVAPWSSRGPKWKDYLSTLTNTLIQTEGRPRKNQAPRKSKK